MCGFFPLPIGLLVEPNRGAFSRLVNSGKRRRSSACNVCLAVHNYPQVMKFDSADVYGGVIGDKLSIFMRKKYV